MGASNSNFQSSFYDLCLNKKMSAMEESKVIKSESFESLGSVDFLSKEFESSHLEETSSEPVMSEHKRKEMNGELLPEPLLMEDKTRFVLFPIKQPDVSEIRLQYLIIMTVKFSNVDHIFATFTNTFRHHSSFSSLLPFHHV